ncbi:MAG: ADP-L-glycero-D-manno-heptose-6-epimerase [Parcubacteria group bacterium CG08_land_8_20_14_0_20_48_21]|nr:MAG: ADP-L-glycero-D-manno-heptose-6-epimerase [Parcubacteria group bacterium CG2_30_48_51]PIS32737.1 MAG: ADP-L-glycero-D-manno-heptose-6-epimerase [Parcubacteria group bacterium CG08_land_8_20_14_0_20_48_21]PIW78811.1 MAG: ADP-L-glycero-D-manno-heptose-6-epimerase [Parcubacteria group bacterium CG_4_8_14_3_um_filter_48_16]PIY78344.1 MAG: ADP-L-glycero-D-manno-heptose-6-epimerase [Parcubacteria group bacterium CG_4_10_14_0_8_um_filter_48_154]PIZ77506.1 MAG: ADP-L-glycero-D-manno-heptose-6-e
MSVKSSKKTILVTGGAGFIGSHLCERLAQDSKNQVLSLDNYFSGKKENHVPGVQYGEGHTKDISKHVRVKPDVIYHLGEYSRVRQSLQEPEVVWDLNIDGTLGVLEFWRKHGCKLIYAGSSTKFTPERPDGVMGRDLAPYTWAKAANSELVRNYARWYGLPYVNVYFYNVYGPREITDAYGAVIGIFKQRFKEGQPLQVASPGTQMRCFTHISDIVDGIILAAKQGEGDGYGIGADDCYSLLEVARMFGGARIMLPQTKSTRSSATVDVAQMRALGWEPKEKLADYIYAITHAKKQ